MQRRCLPALSAIIALFPVSLAAQSPLAADLWRVAAGTVAAPAPLVGGAAALLWTPVISLPPEASAELGATSFHAPEDVGVTGGAASLSLRVGGTIVSAAWARLGIDGIVQTETSPEGLGNGIEANTQVLALGLTRRLRPWLDAGVTARVASDRLGSATATRGAMDAGAVATAGRVTVGAALRSLDPFSDGGTDRGGVVAAELRSGTSGALGLPTTARWRYGLTLQRGEAAAHLLSAGIVLGPALALDLGAVRESRGGDSVWRSRVGMSLNTRQYHIQFGRDGGVHGFGATYALGLAARFL